MTTPNLLRFENITFGYPSAGKPVLQDFNLEIGAGTVTAILGPNGAGKTTLLHLILGWLLPQRGQILLAGKSLKSHTRREIGRWMGLVPQTERIPFDYSLLEFTLFGRTPHLGPLEMPGAPDIQIARSALEQVGLGAMWHRSVTSLSGGERQLVLIARALAQQPRLLLLDEPTSHLDLGNKRRLLDLLRTLTRQGVTILLTTHEPDVAAAVATHGVLMRAGQVLQNGPLDEIFTADSLSAVYNTPVEVHQQDGRRMILWT